MVNLSEQRLLVIAPHLDDEVIGCGGLITKVKEAGGEVYVLFLTNGDVNDVSKKGYSSAKERVDELGKVAKFLNYDGYEIAFGSNDHHLKLDNIPQAELINEIESNSPLSIKKLRPTIILSIDHLSYNQDHRAVAKAAFTACRPASKKLKDQPNMFLTYESPADQWKPEKMFSPNFFAVLNTNFLNKKLEALNLYKSQLRKRANPRSPKSVKSLAVIRGAQCGTDLAEGFFCHRVSL